MNQDDIAVFIGELRDRYKSLRCYKKLSGESKISWTDKTFNPWIGCTKVSPACEECYAEKLGIRYYCVKWGNKSPRKKTSLLNWKIPLIWNKAANVKGKPIFVFCASLADVFDSVADPKWRAELFELIKNTPDLVWLLLTKRPQNIEKMLPSDWNDGYSNVWLGVTAENQHYADLRIPILAKIPAIRRFVSIEPQVGPIILGEHIKSINWIIAGGESGAGKKSRKLNPDWIRNLRDECIQSNKSFFFKQWGHWCPNDTGEMVFHRNLKDAGRLIDGKEWSQRPQK